MTKLKKNICVDEINRKALSKTSYVKEKGKDLRKTSIG